MFIILNSYHDAVTFVLPKVPGGLAWKCSIDTNQADQPEETRYDFGDDYIVTGRSLLLFELILAKEYVEATISAANSTRRKAADAAPTVAETLAAPL